MIGERPPTRSTAAARVGRTRDLPATGDGQRVTAVAVDHGALPTPLSGLTPARMPRGVNSSLSCVFLERNLSRNLRASVRPVGGGAKAGELPRRVGCDRRRAQVMGRATVHGPPCDLPTSRSGSGRRPRGGRPRWASAHVPGLGIPHADMDTRGQQRPAASRMAHGCSASIAYINIGEVRPGNAGP